MFGKKKEEEIPCFFYKAGNESMRNKYDQLKKDLDKLAENYEVLEMDLFEFKKRLRDTKPKDMYTVEENMEKLKAIEEIERIIGDYPDEEW